MRTFIVQEMDQGVLIQTTELDNVIDSDGMVHLVFQHQIIARLQTWLNDGVES